MAGQIVVSSIKTDSDNSISFLANTGATIFSANLASGLSASSFGDNTITSDKIVSVANTKLTGTITNSQLGTDAVSNTKIAAGAVEQYFADTGYNAQFRNRIINGDMRIDQRNAGAAVTVGTSAGGTYGVDRWWGYTGTGSLWQVDQVTTSDTDFPYATRIQRIAGQTSTSAIFWGQVIEYNNMYDMAGQQATLSFYATAGSDFSGTNVKVFVFSGTVADQGTNSLNTAAWTGLTTELNGNVAGLFVPTTSRQKFTFTFTLDAGIKELAVRLNWAGSGTAGANDYIDITGVQLEVGSVATPFERRPYGTELALCQRYYYKIIGSDISRFGLGYVVDGTRAYIMTTFPTTMRTSPTAVEQTGTAANYGVLTGVTSTTCSSVPTFNVASEWSALTQFTVASGLTASQSITARPLTSSVYLGWSAEL